MLYFVTNCCGMYLLLMVLQMICIAEACLILSICLGMCVLVIKMLNAITRLLASNTCYNVNMSFYSNGLHTFMIFCNLLAILESIPSV